MNQELWRKVEDRFHAALERLPEERQSFLDSACDGDAALRRQAELRFHASLTIAFRLSLQTQHLPQGRRLHH